MAQPGENDMKKVTTNFKALIALMVCSAVFNIGAAAQETKKYNAHSMAGQSNLREYSALPAISERMLGRGDFLSLVLPLLNSESITQPQFFVNEASSALYREITKRLGIRYRFYGTDDRGYDCSGFVWRVFQSAGSDFERVAARSLWAQLPEASDDEKIQFGTLVFFNGLRHVGIVKDSKTFYHASRSQGVTLSTFDGYWGGRITGFRRAPARISLIN